MSDKREPTGKKQEIERLPDGRFPKGVSGNPNGRPAGTRNFSTILDEAISELAKSNNIEETQVERDLLKMALTQARKGNYQYFKDLMDRKYGQASQRVEVDDVSLNIDV